MLLLHLTDLHIRELDATRLHERVLAVPDTCLTEAPHIESVLILLSGDIAYSGSVAEYGLAENLINTIKARFHDRGVSSVAVVVAPGNHDCDFAWEHSATRQALLEGPPSAIREPAFLLGPQASFQSFSDKYGSTEELHPLVRQHKSEALPGVVVWAINSAWSSQLHEKPGALILPSSVFDVRARVGDTVIAIMHHPIGWFTPEIQRRLNRWLAGNVHLVLLGHEHLGDTFQQTGYGSSRAVTFRLGEAFNPHKSSDTPGFGAYLLNSQTFELQERVFLLRGKVFELQERSDESIPLRRPLRQAERWFSDAFIEDFLNDLGLTLQHQRKNSPLSLDDVFVFPQLRRRDWRSRIVDDQLAGSVRRADIVSEVLQAPTTVVLGAENSGLTTLGKMLCVELAELDHRPLYVAVDRMQLSRSTQVTASLERLLRSQARTGVQAQLLPHGASLRIAVVDNFDVVPVGARLGVLHELRRRFDRIVILARDVLEVESALDDRQTAEVLRSAIVWDLLPVGHELRGELIRKWLRIGAGPEDSPEVFRANCTFARRTVDQMIGRFMLPKTPVSILLILQQLEALRDSRSVITDGSQGYFIAAIATEQLRARVRCVKVDGALSFLALLAREIRALGHSRLTKQDFRRVHLSYQQIYLHDVPLDRLLAELTRAGILRTAVDENGETTSVGFRYAYWYAFFLARYVAVTNDEWSRTQFQLLIDTVFSEESTQTLSFLAHFTQDDRVVKALVESAGALFADSPVCDLCASSATLVELHRALPRPTLIDGDDEELERGRDRQQDLIESGRLGGGAEIGPSENSSDVNRAFKTIQVLGQILRASTGSMRGETKLEVIEACVALVRRFLGSFMEGMHAAAPALIDAAAASFRDRNSLTEEKARKAAKALVAAMLVGAVSIGVSRITSALGARDLGLVYSRFEQKFPDKTSRLLLLAIKLEHFPEFPENEVDDYVRELRDQEVIPKRILQLTLVKRWNIFRHSFQIKRRYCAKLGIAHKSQPDGPAPDPGRREVV